MTGPEHYQEAERILGRVQEISGRLHEWVPEESEAPVEISMALAKAQVHATLAHAAATALAEGHRDNAAWCAAAGTPVVEEVSA